MSGFKIESIHAFVAVDPVDGDEGVMAFYSANGPVPMIAADKRRLDELRPLAERLAEEAGLEVRLLRFDKRTTVEILNEGAFGKQCDDLLPHDPHGTCPGKTFPGVPTQ
jgi:hypothetical protein